MAYLFIKKISTLLLCSFAMLMVNNTWANEYTDRLGIPEQAVKDVDMGEFEKSFMQMNQKINTRLPFSKNNPVVVDVYKDEDYLYFNIVLDSMPQQISKHQKQLNDISKNGLDFNKRFNAPFLNKLCQPQSENDELVFDLGRVLIFDYEIFLMYYDENHKPIHSMLLDKQSGKLCIDYAMDTILNEKWLISVIEEE